MLKIVAALDPLQLEAELLDRLDRAHPHDRLARSLVVVPTTRLAGHIRRRMLERRRAWLGVEVLHLKALAAAILAAAGAAPPRIASSRQRESVLRRLLRDAPDTGWSAFAERRPGAVRRLLTTFDDLREAEVDARELHRIPGCSLREQELARLYHRYVAALDTLAPRGWTDPAGYVRTASSRAAEFAAGLQAVFFHGAYELIGVHLALLRAIGDSAATTVLVPHQSGAPAAEYAAPLHAWLADAGATVERPSDATRRPRRLALDALYAEADRPQPSEVEFEFRHARGELAEIESAVRSALGRIRDGCPPAEIAIVGRSLEPYGPAIERALDAARIPWSSDLTVALRRVPAVRDLLLVLEVVAEDFPRLAGSELLASPRIRWSALLGDGAPRSGDLADSWSRQARIVGGLDEWSETLPRWAGTLQRNDARPEQAARERRAEARRMAAALAELRTRAGAADDSWPGHASRLERLVESVVDFGAAPREAREALLGLLEEMRSLGTFEGSDRPVRFARMRTWLEDAVDGSSIALRSDDDGGLRLLDAVRARGLTFRHIHLVGMNSGLFPKPPRDDPALSDRVRRHLRERLGRPLAVRERGRSEERLLLAITLGAARDGIAVSWQRADESGRASTPSLALREIARIAFGEPEPQRPLRVARHLPSHPLHYLEEALQTDGMLSPAQATLLAALAANGADAAAALGARDPRLAHSAGMLRATQSFERLDPRYDGRVGDLVADGELSVSALETLGRCPLRFFFERVLRVRELDEEVDTFEIAARDRGIHVHRLLEMIYRTLDDEGRFDAPDRALAERAAELLEVCWNRTWGTEGDRMARRLPVLWRLTSERWIEALRSFLAWDLGRITDERWRPLGFEHEARAALDLGGGTTAHLVGRLDRRFRRADRTVVGDYKTSGKLKDRTDPTSMLKGTRLQVALYRLLEGDDAVVELLGVGLDHDDGNRRAALDSLDGELHDSLLHTVRTLVETRNAGVFPFDREDDRYCGRCPYRAACRRNHPPSVHRESIAPDAESFRALRRKSKSRPDGR